MTGGSDALAGTNPAGFDFPNRQAGKSRPADWKRNIDVTQAVDRFAPFGEMRDAELRMLTGLVGPPRTVERGEIIRHEGDPAPAYYLLVEGWTASTVSFATGGRHILKVHMPGDMLGLPSLALCHAADTILALSRAVIHNVPLPSLGKLFEESPRLAAMLFLISQEERIMLMDRLATTGRANSAQRVAAFLLQLVRRSSRIRPDEPLSLQHPLTQSDLADLAGLSTVQVNRTLKHFARDGVAKWSQGMLQVLDLRALQKTAGLPVRDLVKDPDWLPRSRV